MSPLFQTIVGSVLRWALTLSAGWLVSTGILDQGNADQVTAGVVAALLTVSWGIWQKYVGHKITLTALDAKPGTPLEKIISEAKR